MQKVPTLFHRLGFESVFVLNSLVSSKLILNVYFYVCIFLLQFFFMYIKIICSTISIQENKSTFVGKTSNNNDNRIFFFLVLFGQKYTAERTNYVRTLNQVALWQNQKQETHSTLSALLQALVAASARCLCFTVSLLRRDDIAIKRYAIRYATCVAFDWVSVCVCKCMGLRACVA